MANVTDYKQTKRMLSVLMRYLYDHSYKDIHTDNLGVITPLGLEYYFSTGDELDSTDIDKCQDHRMLAKELKDLLDYKLKKEA